MVGKRWQMSAEPLFDAAGQIRQDVSFALTAAIYAALPPFAGAKVIYAAANRLGARAVRENRSEEHV